MTIQMADKLVALRKAAGLSQDEVANRIGVSRQAVSKWERAEAAPDTDNLIALANLYNVSVDELLCIDQKNKTNTDNTNNPYVEVKLPFIKIKVHDNDKNGSTQVETEFDDTDNQFSSNADNFYNSDNNNYNDNDRNTTSGNFTYVYDSKKDKKNSSLWLQFPYPILATAAYLVMGFVWNLWHPGWIVFLTIPVYYWLANAITKRRFPSLSISFAITLIYLVMGCVWDLWHPYWIIFITIPIFEFIAKAIKGLLNKNK